MAATPSIKISKTMPYRGATVTFSNRYHFSGSSPVDNSHWTTFADAIVAAEKAIYSSAASDITIVAATGYDAGSDVPVFEKAYSVAGTGASLGGTQAPGDCAALVRYSTAARSSKNHPVYLFNYYHGARIAVSETGADALTSAYKSALGTYASSWESGFSDGTVTHHRTGPNGASATGHFIEDYVTHRDFPR
jgi:hypothetical protein